MTAKTRKRAASPEAAPAMSAIVAVLEMTWATIRKTHAEVPDAVIVVGQGSDKRGINRWGHHAPERWETSNGRLPEVMVSGEGLNRDATEILVTLLHEAAHGVAHSRGTKDTSGQGNRYHTQAFVAVANELGLAPPKERHDRHGYSACTLRDETAQWYAAELAAIKAALTMFRHAEAGEDGPKKPTTRSGVAARCAPQCDRRITVGPTVLELGPITCGCCFDDFKVRSEDDEPESDDPIERLVADYAASVARMDRLTQLLEDENARIDEMQAMARELGLPRRNLIAKVKAFTKRDDE